MASKKRASKTAEKQQDFDCPVCLLVGCIREMVDRESPFFEHMNNARIEFLEGVKALIETRIEAMKKGKGPKKSRLTKIRVED